MEAYNAKFHKYNFSPLYHFALKTSKHLNEISIYNINVVSFLSRFKAFFFYSERERDQIIIGAEIKNKNIFIKHLIHLI